jgi:ferredoxin
VPQGATLLEVAESNAIEIPFSCRQGQCGTCATRLIEGQVDMCCEDGLSPAQKTAGFVLMCVARPRSNVKVEA